MLLQEVFNQLQVNELNNLSFVDQHTKEIDPVQYKNMIIAINAGLTALHTRFLLRIGQMKIKLLEGVETYHLDKRNLMTGKGKNPDAQFIMPYPPFNGGLLKIHRVLTDEGRELAMNNYEEDWSVHTPQYDTLYVPSGLHGKHKVDTLRVEFRQDHRMIPTCDGAVDPECYGLTLERSHLWALCLFVASRLHYPVGLNDATYSGNSFMAQYEKECQRLENTGLEISQLGISNGHRMKGFP